MSAVFKHKARDAKVTPEFLAFRVQRAEQSGYSKQKWVSFCEAMLERGHSLTLYEARKTVSKYITVSNGKRSFRIRFSNHMPNKGREIGGDCDFFVGRTHTGVRTTNQAIDAVDRFFGAES